MAASTGPVEIVVCETHGLRYNRAAESGCVRCRRESGVVAAAPGGGAGAGATTGAAADRPASAGVQLLVAALLIGGSGTLFWSAHQAVLDSFDGSTLAIAGRDGAKAAAAPSQRHDFGSSDPSAWPPPAAEAQDSPAVDPRGHGPGEEQKQLDEFFRQMREEAAKERQPAPPPPPQTGRRPAAPPPAHDS
jgi:hypothetical protein